jgi:DNA-binding NarL/FixJ family response regulator
MPIRVVVADDNSLIRSQIRAVLKLDPDVDLCAEAVNGVDALRKVQETHPDVVIVDFQMPLMNGLEVTRRIKARVPFIRVLIFALDYSSQLKWESERAGADAILPKAQGGSRLSRVVHSLMNSN